MTLIKVQFLKGDSPYGRHYTYQAHGTYFVGDKVKINDESLGIVTAVDVDPKEVESFADRLETILGIVHTYDRDRAVKAQSEYCDQKKYPHFAPGDGRCYSCRQNIYSTGRGRSGKETNGISVERAGRELITGCPHCSRSYCD